MTRFCKHCQQNVEVSRDSFSSMEICSICGIALSDLYLAAGTIVGGFMVENEIGRGGMGIVYKARQLNLERQVALKILSDTLSRDVDFVDRFFQEARAAASLSHPNIVQAFDAGSTPEGIYYLAMELIEGETLDTRITRDGAMHQDIALNISGKIANAMNYAWQKQKLCHGDIKPDNIILNSSGDAKLADLGLAKTAHDTRENEIMGTPLYAAPELIRGDIDHINMKSDIYSFGATLYHMLAGAPPFPGHDPDEVMKRHMVEAPVPLLERNREINPGLSALVDQLLSKNPHDRPASWAEVVEAIEFIHQHKEHKVAQKTQDNIIFNWEKKTVEEKKPLNKLLLRLLLVLAVLLAVMLFYFLGLKHSKSPGGSPDIAAKWEKIKAQTQFMITEKAVEDLETFVNIHKERLPPDASSFIAELKAKQLSEKNIKNKKTEFQRDMDEILAIEAPALAKMNQKALNELKNKALSILNRPKNESYLAPLLNEKTGEISSKIKTVNSMIAQKKEEEIRLASQEKLKKEKAQKEKEEKEKQLKAEKERKDREEKEKIAREQKQKLEMNSKSQVDEYFKVCAEFLSLSLKKRTPEQLLNDISEFQKKNKHISQPCAGRIAFLKKNLSGAQSLIDVYIKNDFLLKGRPVPLKSADPEYKVEAVDAVSITLFMTDGKVRLGRKIKWAAMKNEEYLELIANTIMLPENISKLDANAQKNVVLYLLLLKKYPEMEIVLSRFPKLSPADKQEWQMIAKDFSDAPMEVEASELWKKINEHIKNKEMEEASAKMGELNAKYGKTGFCKRYDLEISAMRKLLKL